MVLSAGVAEPLGGGNLLEEIPNRGQALRIYIALPYPISYSPLCVCTRARACTLYMQLNIHLLTVLLRLPAPMLPCHCTLSGSSFKCILPSISYFDHSILL